MDRLGSCYLNGIGTERNVHLAFQYFQRAANLGNIKGQCNLAQCYMDGTGCTPNMALAFQLISRATDPEERGWLAAMTLHSLGLDIPKLAKDYNKFQRMRAEKERTPFSGNFDRAFREAKRTIWAVSPNAGEV